MKRQFSFVILVLFYCLSHESIASHRYPRSTAAEKKIKTINYDPNGVHVYNGFYGIQCSIVFDVGETIDNMLMGSVDGWQLVPYENRLFLKPIDDDVDTNVTIITNRRLYHFEFHAYEPTEDRMDDVAYEVRFVYSGSYASNDGNNSYNTTIIPDVVSEAANLNFAYKISGSEKIAPLMVFDDGEFTYVKFASINSELPAIFLIDSTGHESMINIKSVDDYLVIERVDAAFTLRLGEEVACLFNTNMELHVRKDKKKAKGIFAKNNR